MIGLLLAMLALPSSLAAPSARQLTAWSTTGAQLLPDATGDQQLRLGQELGMELPIGPALHVSTLGLARMTAEAGSPDKLDLLRMTMGYHGSRFTVRMGRMTRLESRGLLHLDGLSLDALHGEPLSFSAWGGLLWHPETWETGLGIAGGGELRLRPRSARTAEAALGYQIRGADESLDHRVHARGGLFGAKGQQLTTLVELGLPSDHDPLGIRAGLWGRLPTSRVLTLAADLRWEGLPQATFPGAVRSPFEWLAPEAYGIASLSGQLRGSGWAASLSGGPTLRTGESEQLGGLSRASMGWDLRRDLQLGAFGTGATIAGSWVGGGGLDAGWNGDRARVSGTAGAYQLQLLDGDACLVWEARLQAEAFLDQHRVGERMARRLGLGAELAAGTDTLLAPWYRGSLVLNARLGRSDWGRP